MSQFFCSSCLLNFLQEPTYKDHYKTDFHRYNIARKMINLDPVSYEVSKEKFDKISEQKIITPIKSQTFKCHLISKSHQLNQLKSPITANRSQTGNSILNSNVCLFFDELCDNIEDCLKIVQILRDCQKHYQNKQIRIILFYIVFKHSKIVMIQKIICQTRDIVLCLNKNIRFYQNITIFKKNYQQFWQSKRNNNYKLKLKNNNYNQNKIKKKMKIKMKRKLKIKMKEIGKMMKIKILIQMMIMKRNQNKNKNKLMIQKMMNILNQISKHKATLTKTGELLLPDGKFHRDYRKYYKQNHIPFKVQETEQIEKLDIADEKQFALLSDELIVGYLRHFYYQKTRTLTYGQTKIGQRNNLIQMRWLRKSC